MKRVARLVSAVFAVISLVLPQGPAFAQAAATESQAAASAYQQALAQYAAGDLKGALANMRESYRLSQRAELLYNIARLESELGDCSASLADYRLYVQQVPDGRYRSDADRATRELEQRCPDATAAPAPAPAPVAAEPPVDPTKAPSVRQIVEPPKSVPSDPPPPAPRAYWTTRRWIGWSLVAAGTVAGVGAVYLTTQAIEARNAFQRNVDAAKNSDGPLDWSLQDRQHRDQHWAQALYVAGGALLAGGAVVLILAPTDKGGNPATAAFYLQPGLLGARISHSF